MKTLNGKNVVIIGGSLGVGRAMVVRAQAAGANTLAVARRSGPLEEVAKAAPGAKTLAADMTDESTPQRIFDIMLPDVIVVCGGATPPTGSFHEQSWESFSKVWDTDMRGTFNVAKAALTKPLAPGSTVVFVSSGAGLMGSPISASYAGAKRMQMFMADYGQEESERAKLGIRFMTIVPKYIMKETATGKVASEGYSRYRNMPVDEFLSRFPHPQTVDDVARAFITLITEEPQREGTVFAVDGQGITDIS